MHSIILSESILAYRVAMVNNKSLKIPGLSYFETRNWDFSVKSRMHDQYF